MDLIKIIIDSDGEVGKENLEVAIDEFLKDGILKDIPVVNTLTSVFKTGKNIRDAYFYKKLTYFLYHMNEIPSEQRKKFYEKSIKDDKNFGEKLIYTLENLDEYKKAEYLAKLYIAYSYDRINYQDFRRLSIALGQLFIDDIEYIKDHIEEKTVKGIIGRSLNNVGLARKLTIVEGESLSIDFKEIEEPFEFTLLARKLNDCLYKVD